MMSTATYLAIAILVAPLLLAASEWAGHRDSPYRSVPSHRLTYALLAAALWPLLVVGLAQFAVILGVRRALRSGDVATAADPPADPPATQFAGAGARSGRV